LFGESFSRQSIGFGLELEVPLSSEIRPSRIRKFISACWIGAMAGFSKRDSLTAGVGGLLRANPKMKEDFEVFLKKPVWPCPAWENQRPFHSLWDFRRTPGRGNIVLCGDAAGLVEPITGEGIAFAMLSGFYAAESAREALFRRERNLPWNIIWPAGDDREHF